MTYNGDLDRILDDALAEYREAAPLAGLEERILQRMRFQAERRRKLWWQWGAALAATAILAAVAWFGLQHSGQRSPIAEKRTSYAQPSPAVAQIQAAPEIPLRNPEIVARKSSLRAPVTTAQQNPTLGRQLFPPPAIVAAGPRLSQFPAPTPLSREEYALLTLVRTNPGLVPVTTRDNDEIAIAPIEIKPLAGDGSENQGDN